MQSSMIGSRTWFRLVAIVWLAATCLWMNASLVFAQEVQPPSSLDWMEMLQGLLRGLLPTLMSLIGPLITKGIQALSGMVPSGWLALLSSFLGSVLSAVTAGLEGLPPEAITVNSAAGAGVGLAAHGLVQTKPIPPAS